MVKTTGVADVLRAALAPLAAQIRVAFVYGSVAKLTQRSGSDVDVMVVGESTFGDVVSALGSAQETLAREINPTAYSPAEFRSKLKAGHHFFSAVVGGEKHFLIGDEHELARLGAKRLGKPAQKYPRRDSKTPGARRSKLGKLIALKEHLRCASSKSQSFWSGLSGRAVQNSW